MAEYIDKEQIKYHRERVLVQWAGSRHTDCDVNYKDIVTKEDINNISAADVIEHNEYIELLKENERLRKDLEDKSEALNSICQIHQKYVSKIDKAIEEIEDLKPNNPGFKGYHQQRVALNKALEILKEI